MTGKPLYEIGIRPIWGGQADPNLVGLSKRVDFQGSTNFMDSGSPI